VCLDMVGCGLRRDECGGGGSIVVHAGDALDGVRYILCEIYPGWDSS
jgi:hypothetical protein